MDRSCTSKRPLPWSWDIKVLRNHFAFDLPSHNARESVSPWGQSIVSFLAALGQSSIEGTSIPRGTSIAQYPASDGIKGGHGMNWDQAKGNWKQVKGKIKEKWGQLTDDELDQIEGKRDQLVGKIQKQYGISKEEAESQVKNWETHQGV
jgi:uncharacterized protein YjbJ (UPF0337 family)